jgi:hypothetical protein
LILILRPVLQKAKRKFVRQTELNGEELKLSESAEMRNAYKKLVFETVEKWLGLKKLVSIANAR